MTEEHYDHIGMRQARRDAIEKAKHARQFGLILGTLGRQGNPRILDHLQSIMGMQFTVVSVSVSEAQLLFILMRPQDGKHRVVSCCAA